MVCSWLTKTSAVLLCTAALANFVAVARPSVTDESVQQDANELHYDSLGNMVWKQGQDLYEQDFYKVWEHGKDLVEDGLNGLDVFRKMAEEQAKHAKEEALRMSKDVLHESSMILDGIRYQRLIHPAFPHYALRIAEEGANEALASCDPDVKSYTGYLDIGHDKHLWFAFFESRSLKHAADKSKEPLVLWLNGGPGCSSSTGWLMEGIGPCTIANNGTGVKYNKHSWTDKASVFFLDQPVNVGFSYSESGSVNNTPDSADDVYAFLSMFFAKFAEYADAPFSVAAESYGGRYAPLIAAKIHAENKKSVEQAKLHGLTAPKTINLKSIMIGNGLTDPKTQFPSLYEYACKSKYALFEPDGPECQTLETKGKTCANLIEQCYKFDSRLTCTPAGLYCWSSMYSDAQKLGRNLYDTRKACDRSPDKDGQLCYREELYVETYMNQPSIKKAFGVPDSVEYKSCNMDINQAFLFNGDGMHNSAAVLPDLVEDGIRVLVYAGVYDLLCEYIGNVGEQSWALVLDHKYQQELIDAKTQDWTVNGKTAGKVRKAGKGAGSFTLVTVYEAGHMVPFDQPENAQALIQAWLANRDINA